MICINLDTMKSRDWMQKAFLYSLLIIISTVRLNGQDADQNELLMSGEFEMIRTDDFGNMYVLDKEKTLSRYDKKLSKLFSYSFYGLGELKDMDVSNPQKLMLFFTDYQTIVFLDNTLSEIKRLELEDIGYWGVTGAAQSPDNFIWIYDPVSYKLIKIDDAGNELYNSNEYYFGQMTDVLDVHLSVNESSVIAYTDSEYMIFDNFGQHLSTRSCKNDKLILMDNSILIQLNNTISVESIKPSMIDSPRTIYTSLEPIIDSAVMKNRFLYVLDNSGVKRKVISN